MEGPTPPLQPFLAPALTPITSTSIPKISASTYFYTYFFTGVMVHGVIRSKGLTTHYKAPFYPNICQHLGPCHNTSHQYTYLDSLLQCLLHGGTKCLTIRYKGQGKPKCYHNYIYMCIYIYIHTHMYRVSQEECARFREGVSYVKVYRCNPKHLCPKLKGYGDNGQRKVWSSGGSTRCTCQLTSLIDVCP